MIPPRSRAVDSPWSCLFSPYDNKDINITRTNTHTSARAQLQMGAAAHQAQAGMSARRTRVRIHIVASTFTARDFPAPTARRYKRARARSRGHYDTPVAPQVHHAPCFPQPMFPTWEHANHRRSCMFIILRIKERKKKPRSRPGAPVAHPPGCRSLAVLPREKLRSREGEGSKHGARPFLPGKHWSDHMDVSPPRRYPALVSFFAHEETSDHTPGRCCRGA